MGRDEENLGAALGKRGQRETGSDAARDEDEAILNFQEALKVFTQQRAPALWAATQHNLGYGYLVVGERTASKTSFQAAVLALREALKETSRDANGRSWAHIQLHLGAALMKLGELESGTNRIEEAIAALRLAQSQMSGDLGSIQYDSASMQKAQQELDQCSALLAQRGKQKSLTVPGEGRD